MDFLKNKIIKFAPPLKPLPSFEKVIKFNWNPTGLTVPGDTELSYEVVDDRNLFGDSAYTVISRTPRSNGDIVGKFDWSKMTAKLEIEFPLTSRELKYQALNGHFDATDLGRLEWRITDMDWKHATWRLLDEDGEPVALVDLHKSGALGTIEIVRMGLPRAAFEEVLVCSIAQIEDHLRMMRHSKNAALMTVAGNTVAVAGINSLPY